ncbi:hypothetical protein [Actinomadura rudentiformis]|uniref:Uncharacterized protein n=1 Tax=Actinomadura rudentiformis TaxID=359158 RepID=A0A6H9YK11_9ACTN|nr:hypothetical protein [Actinomadura rudentiformis]KAB2347345.1 hypothetical protein F8566_20245 [Actinomadura rudentiformis]
MTDDRPIPPPRNPTDRILTGIYDRLGELLDKFPAPAERENGTVELREPAAPAPDGGGENPPASPTAGGKGTGVTPARRSSPRPAKTTTRKRGTAAKEK